MESIPDVWHGKISSKKYHELLLDNLIFLLLITSAIQNLKVLWDIVNNNKRQIRIKVITNGVTVAYFLGLKNVIGLSRELGYLMTSLMDSPLPTLVFFHDV